MNLFYSRLFVLFADGEASKPYNPKNGLVQGSILAPTLHNIYTSDFPSTSSPRKRPALASRTALFFDWLKAKKQKIKIFGFWHRRGQDF